MNDLLATILALALIYLVLKFAFGGPSSSNQRPGVDQPGRPMTATERRIGAGDGLATTTSATSSKQQQTLIEKFGLQSRMNGWTGSPEQGAQSSPSAAGASSSAMNKGKGKAASEEEWKKGADKRKEDLQRRKEEMILEARR